MTNEPLRFWRDLTLVTAFFILAPLTLGLSIFSLVNLNAVSHPVTASTTVASNLPRTGVQVYASLPTNFPTITATVETKDARVEIVRQYLASYNSPLTAYAQNIVDEADKYNLDWKLLPAIAQKESNLCRIIPYGSYNCWGWGITSVSSLSFDSFPDGIEIVSRGLKENYIDEGYITPDQIMTKYTPSSPNGVWAKDVRQFMSDISEE